MASEKADRASAIVLGVALAVPWLYIWQGLDLTDQGYLLTLYRCFLHCPETAADSGSVWLTALVGGVWDVVYGNVGVVGMRGLWALCMSIGMLCAYRLVKRTSSARLGAATILASSIFLSSRRETWFSYNTSSSLLWVALALCLTLGLVEKRRGLLFAAGALLIALPLARFPNVVGLSLLATPGLVALAFAERRSGWLKETGLMLAGGATASVCALLLMLALGHVHSYAASIQSLFTPGQIKEGYEVDSLFGIFLKDQATALAWGLALSLVGLILAQTLAQLPRLLAWAAVLGLAGVSAARLSGTHELWRFVVPGVAYWVLGAVALGFGRLGCEQRLVAFIALVILVLAPLGSYNGIKNAHVGLWLAAPFMLSLIASLDGAWLAGQAHKLALLGCLVLAGEGLHRGATYTYRDEPRTKLAASVGAAQLRGQFTSKARAKAVAQVLAALRTRVAPDDYLLAYEGTPLLQYLTKTRPYLGRAWLSGTESPDVVRVLAAEAPKRTGCLPVVVTARYSTRSANWPERAGKLESTEPQRGTRAVIKRFLRRHDYERSWDNEFFEILEPPASARGKCRPGL